MTRERLLAALAASMLATGCATLTAPRHALLQVDSIPPGAAVRVNGVGGGRTPAVVEVERRAPPPVVEVAMPGKPPARCRTTMSVGAPYVTSDVLLCIFLFPIGCISFIDASGAWNVLDAPYCNVVFTAPPAGPAAQPPGPPPQATPPPPPPAPPPPTSPTP